MEIKHLTLNNLLVYIMSRQLIQEIVDIILEIRRPVNRVYGQFLDKPTNVTPKAPVKREPKPPAPPKVDPDASELDTERAKQHRSERGDAAFVRAVILATGEDSATVKSNMLSSDKRKNQGLKGATSMYSNRIAPSITFIRGL